jgi:hypothetical protein
MHRRGTWSWRRSPCRPPRYSRRSTRPAGRGQSRHHRSTRLPLCTRRTRNTEPGRRTTDRCRRRRRPHCLRRRHHHHRHRIRLPERERIGVRLAQNMITDRCALLWEYSYKRLQLAQRLGQLGAFPTRNAAITSGAEGGGSRAGGAWVWALKSC